MPLGTHQLQDNLHVLNVHLEQFALCMKQKLTPSHAHLAIIWKLLGVRALEIWLQKDTIQLEQELKSVVVMETGQQQERHFLHNALPVQQDTTELVELRLLVDLESIVLLDLQQLELVLLEIIVQILLLR